jgi:hypothetical protein
MHDHVSVTMRKTYLAVAACVLLAGALLAGCGSDSKKDASNTDSSSPVVIDATVRGNDLTPNGDRVEVAVGQTVTIKLNADRDGELHVHSTPEQELEYKKGDNTFNLHFDTPGIIEIEDHIADKTLVSLEIK